MHIGRFYPGKRSHHFWVLLSTFVFSVRTRSLYAHTDEQTNRKTTARCSL